MSHANIEEQKVLQDLSTRAAVDKAFRAKVLSDPHAALTEVAGVSVPSTFRVKFIEKDAGIDALIVLPDYIDASSELSVEELEAVAGGNAGDCWVLSCVTSCGLSCGLTCGITTNTVPPCEDVATQ